jgi:hypothetical protein
MLRGVCLRYAMGYNLMNVYTKKIWYRYAQEYFSLSYYNAKLSSQVSQRAMLNATV